MIHREALCNLLWPNQTEAEAKCQLRKTLWRLRSALSPLEQESNTEVICISEHQVGLDHAQIASDYWRFTDAMKSLELKSDTQLDCADARVLLTAIELNSDTFATGVFDEWCLAEKESMEGARLGAMERLIGYHRAHEHWQQAISRAQEALTLDPIREHLHYSVMACHLSLGDRASAIRQYKRCEEVLKSELGIGPSTELRALYQRLTDQRQLGRSS
jgi:DNA-binding SARP family transcriptional activator